MKKGLVVIVSVFVLITHNYSEDYRINLSKYINEEMWISGNKINLISFKKDHGNPTKEYIYDEYYKNPNVINSKLYILEYDDRNYQFFADINGNPTAYIYCASFKNIEYIGSKVESIYKVFGQPDEENLYIDQYTTKKKVGYADYYVEYKKNEFYLVEFHFENDRIVLVSYSIAP